MIALDATYSVGEHLSGVGVYSRELLHGLAARGGNWEWFYRHRAWARSGPVPGNVKRRLLFDVVGSRKADLFHGLNQRLLKRRFRRQIATFHDLFVMTAEYSTPEFRERFTEQARRAAQQSDLVVAVSQFTASQVEELFAIPQSRIHVVHHGVSPRMLPPVPREKVVLCVGAIQARKNQLRLVQAFRALPDDWRLVLAGSSGYRSEETMDAIRNSPAANRILVTGYISETELSAWYAKASIFAFPSLDEGFGMPVLDAMAAGVPVVAANRSAIPEVVGDAAILVDPLRKDDLAEALKMLIPNGPEHHSYVEKGYQRARLYTWNYAVEKTAALYKLVS